MVVLYFVIRVIQVGVCLRWRLNFMTRYLRGNNVISHVPKAVIQVRRVGESEAFDFGGDGADDSVRLLVRLLHDAHVPGGVQEAVHQYTFTCGEKDNSNSYKEIKRQ